MKKTILISVLLWLSFPVFSQQSYYIFIQSDKAVPFYTRFGDTILSSSIIGHLVIPGLKDSSYSLHIGFSGKESNEAVFTVRINGKDRGFEFKNLPNDGWVLYDWQSMEMIRSAKNSGLVSGSLTLDKRTDEFAQLMAGLVNDSSVLYKTIARSVTETPPKTPKKESVTHSSELTAATNTDRSTIPAEKDSVTVVAQTQEKQKGHERQDPTDTGTVLTEISPLNESMGSPVTTIEKKEFGLKLESEFKSKDQLERLYLDRSESGTDSIQVIIPVNNEESLVASDSVNPETAGDSIVYGSKKEESIDSDNSPEAKGIVMINSDCRNFASVNDLDKLRLAILKEDKLEDKLTAARKTFRSMCFTTKQIAALTELFITDEAKFLLFESAYPFVSDSGNFKSLAEHLKDSFYLTRFRVLTKA